MNRWPRRLAAAALMALAAMLTQGAPAHAVPGDITWMVRPSDGVGEDGRAWVERELDPGDSVVEHLLVRNLSAEPVTFVLTAADGYFTETGRFNMLTADRVSTGAGTWIDLPSTVEVQPGADIVVPFTLTVPLDASPGDHPAGVAAGIRSTDGEVGVESRVGFRVMTRVTGELAPALALDASAAHSGSWNPFAPGRAEVQWSVRNDGNTRLSVTPQMTVTSLFGLASFTATADEVVDMAPGELRSGRVDLPDVWPLGLYTAEVSATAESVPALDAEAGMPTVSTSVNLLAIPWTQAATVALLAAIVLALVADHRRRARAIDRRIAQARLDGAVEARSARV